MTEKRKNISVVGLGKLGTPFALAMANTGLTVYCFDVNKESLRRLGDGICALYEQGAQEMLSINRKRMQYPSTYSELVGKSDITFVIVPTPSTPDGSFSLRYIKEVITDMGHALKNKKTKHTIVVTSTVSPRSMDKEVAPLLEKITGKRIGDEIGLCYSPEFIALGSVIHNLQYPDFLLIGESDSQSGDLLEKIRLSVCKNKPRVVRTNWINAEITKISLNSYITMKISFANMIARISERTAGADADIITRAIGADSRVGSKYLRGGLGFGGPCFPRDNVALSSFISDLGLPVGIPDAVHKFNNQQLIRVAEFIKKHCDKKQTIGFLGMSYKPGTDVIDESQSVLLAKHFTDRGYKVVAHDPAAAGNAKKILPGVDFAPSANACVAGSDVIVISTDWDQYKRFPWQGIAAHKTIIDCWKTIDDPATLPFNIKYISLGMKK